MATEIVFGGGASIIVAQSLEQVAGDIEGNGFGRPLLRYQLEGEHSRAGEPVDVLVNWGEIAYIREPERRGRGMHGF
jgi:hypothetical protein